MFLLSWLGDSKLKDMCSGLQSCRIRWIVPKIKLFGQRHAVIRASEAA